MIALMDDLGNKDPGLHHTCIEIEWMLLYLVLRI